MGLRRQLHCIDICPGSKASAGTTECPRNRYFTNIFFRCIVRGYDFCPRELQVSPLPSLLTLLLDSPHKSQSASLAVDGQHLHKAHCSMIPPLHWNSTTRAAPLIPQHTKFAHRVFVGGLGGRTRCSRPAFTHAQLTRIYVSKIALNLNAMLKHLECFRWTPIVGILRWGADAAFGGLGQYRRRSNCTCLSVPKRQFPML